MRIININKIYHNLDKQVHALKDVSVDFIDTGMCFIMGKSGCGKSTLLRILAGLDSDYSGSVELSDTTYYVSSEYDLFNELSVMENLLLTRNRKRRIVKMIEHFNLTDRLNKKVKLLSNGEKRRVQLIKALLMDKHIILLDETASALDHDNLITVMDLLKTLSKDHLIIIVTHNDTLLDHYADQIITLSDGCLMNNKIINYFSGDNTTVKQHTNTRKKDLSRALFAYSKELLSYKLSLILIAVLTVLTSTISINLFTSTRNNSNTKQLIESNKATLTAMPLKTTPNMPDSYAVYQSVYGLYNSFYYQDIMQFVAENKDIIAINPYYSFKYSDEVSVKDGNEKYYTTRDGSKYSENYPIAEGMFNNGPREFCDYLLSEAYYMDQANCDTFACSQNFHNNDRDSQVIMNKVNVYSLVNDYASVIRLLYGDFGTQANEIVVDYSLANKLVKLYQLDCVEALLNHEFTLHVVRKSNAFSKERNYSAISGFTFDMDDIDAKYIHQPYESVSFIITGISEYDNKSENNAYLTVPLLQNPLIAQFINDNDHANLPFRTLNIMVNPQSDTTALKESFNQFFHLDQSEFRVMSDLAMLTSTDESYKVNTPTIVVASLIALISLCSFVFVMVKHKGKQKKTMALLERMNYKKSYLYVSFLVEIVIILFVSYATSFIIQIALNTIGKDFVLSQLIDLNFGLIGLFSGGMVTLEFAYTLLSKGINI